MFKNDRPKIKIPYSRKHLFIDIFTFLGILSMATAVSVASKYVPEKVPMHFDLAGNPDGFGSPGEFLILSLLLPGTLFLIWNILLAARFFPRIINYPVEINEANAAIQYKLAGELLYNLKISLVLLFMCIETLIIQSAFSGRMNGTILIITALIPTIYSVVIFTIRSIRNK